MKLLSFLLVRDQKRRPDIYSVEKFFESLMVTYDYRFFKGLRKEYEWIAGDRVQGRLVVGNYLKFEKTMVFGRSAVDNFVKEALGGDGVINMIGGERGIFSWEKEVERETEAEKKE